MNRKQVLEHIRVEYATHGKATAKAVRRYAENRVSYSAYMRAANRGLDIYVANSRSTTQFDGVVTRAQKRVIL